MMERRTFLGGLGGLPLLSGLLTAAPAGAEARKGKKLILLWMDGGMSHLDTFDGKPDAPPDVRGDLGVVRSSLDGVFVSEHLPKLAGLMDRMALVRSLTSPEGNHDRGSHFMLTGRRPSPVLAYPSAGSVLGKLREVPGGNPIPPYVAIPDAHAYARQGFLPVPYAPFELKGDPSKPDFRVRDLVPAGGASDGRRAMDLLKQVDAFDGVARSAGERARDAFVAQAGYLSMNAEVRSLFELKGEAPALREAYGRHFFGQGCLLARRLVEGGVGTVVVRYRGWDHHQAIKREMTYGFPPKLVAVDQAVSALHADLERRGLLEDVLVVLASEFGRTPRLNPSGGRDHWSRASSALMFGAGLKEGVVVGETDARGEEPAERPVTPGELYATMLSALGTDVGRVMQTPDGRPVRLVDEGVRPVAEVLA